MKLLSKYKKEILIGLATTLIPAIISAGISLKVNDAVQDNKLATLNESVKSLDAKFDNLKTYLINKLGE